MYCGWDGAGPLSRYLQAFWRSRLLQQRDEFEVIGNNLDRTSLFVRSKAYSCIVDSATCLARSHPRDPYPQHGEGRQPAGGVGARRTWCSSGRRRWYRIWLQTLMFP